MKFLPLIIAGATVLLSCENKNSAVSESRKDTAVKTGTEMQANSETTVEAEAVATAATERPALNPPHGEPFHRCDIQVGAPIDSAPQQSAAPLTQQGSNPGNFNTNPISPSVSVSPATDNTGPKPALNPPHGEPHHRCDLQVGAPLT